MASLFISLSKSLLKAKGFGGETDMFLEETRMCDIFYRLLSGIGSEFERSFTYYTKGIL